MITFLMETKKKGAELNFLKGMTGMFDYFGVDYKGFEKERVG